MNKQELITRIKCLDESYLKESFVLGLIEQLDEPQKVTVPQFVADWYEENKDSFDYNLWEYLTDWEEQEPSDFKNWINDEYNTFKTLVNMHQFGYEVEQEKRYLVKVIGVGKFYECLNFDTTDKNWKFFDCDNTEKYRTHHTRKELEEAGFGWVFDCEGMEVDEVGK